MKKAFIITVALLTTSSFAGGKGYKIVDEQIHSAPGFNFHVEDVPAGTVLALKKTSLTGRTRTCVTAKSGHAYDYITMDGYHDFTISNNIR